MTSESANDAFERRYMASFQMLAATYGVVVKYERDRAARDIGVHIFRKTSSGTEEATGSLVWFQMKGIQESTLSLADLDERRFASVTLRVKDLRLWYRMDGPTYLVVYLECADQFLVMDIVKYVEEKYGTEIMGLEQETVTVRVGRDSKLDEQAFDLIARKGTAKEWRRVLGAAERDIRLALRDYQLIWRMATARKRGIEHRVVMRDWQSKMRGEVYFQERPRGGDDAKWQDVRGHWQSGLRIEGIERAYPYLRFGAWKNDGECDDDYWCDDDAPSAKLSSGEVVYGEDCCGEYNLYVLLPAVNAVGKRLVRMVQVLVRYGLVEAPDVDKYEFLDVAPWHSRDV